MQRQIWGRTCSYGGTGSWIMGLDRVFRIEGPAVGLESSSWKTGKPGAVTRTFSDMQWGALPFLMLEQFLRITSILIFKNKLRDEESFKVKVKGDFDESKGDPLVLWNKLCCTGSWFLGELLNLQKWIMIFINQVFPLIILFYYRNLYLRILGIYYSLFIRFSRLWVGKVAFLAFCSDSLNFVILGGSEDHWASWWDAVGSFLSCIGKAQFSCECSWHSLGVKIWTVKTTKKRAECCPLRNHPRWLNAPKLPTSFKYLPSKWIMPIYTWCIC